MSESSEFNLYEAADEIIAESEPQAESTQETSADGQSETNPTETANEEVSAKDILNQVAEEKPAPEEANALLEQINQLGAIHNGMPIKLDSPEQLKEILQKGFDYTKKTQAHAEEVRVRQEEFSKKEAQFKEMETTYAQKEQEIQNTVFENKIMENLLLKWQGEDPELFQYLSQAYQKEVRAYEMQKPLISQYENQFKQLNDRFAQLEQVKQKEELGAIKQGWEKELGDVQTRLAGSLAKIGVKPDWKKVEAAWSADVSGSLSVEDALYAVHGKDIIKANESRAKLLETKHKTQTKMLNRSGVGSAQNSGPTIKANVVGDYESILRQAVNQL